MWAELLPKTVGGTIVDHDMPESPATIIGYRVTDDWVEVQTDHGWSFGGARHCTGINAGETPGTFIMRAPLLAATITMPDLRPKKA